MPGDKHDVEADKFEHGFSNEMWEKHSSVTLSLFEVLLRADEIGFGQPRGNVGIQFV
jgi:hypothetical protein